MSNTTKNRRSGCGNITIDTEVTQNGEYPVEGKGIYAFVNANKGMTNPMTTVGDIIYGAWSGAPKRLAKGNSGQVLGMVGANPGWVTRDYYMTPIKASSTQCGIALWCSRQGESSLGAYLLSRYHYSDNPYPAVYGVISGKAIASIYVDVETSKYYAVLSDASTTEVTFGSDATF